MTMASSSSEAEPLVHAAFNSNATHFVAATASGIRVFSCTPRLKHAFGKVFVPSLDAAGFSRVVVTADLAPSGTLAAVVLSPEPPPPSSSAPDDESESDSIRYCSAGLRGKILSDDEINHAAVPCRRVRAVLHAGGHMVVAGDGEATLYDTSSARTLRRLLRVATGSNPLAVYALAEARRDWKRKTAAVPVLACPLPAKGHVQLCRGTAAATAGVDVHAHRSAVVCVALSHDGSLLATASSKGTVVRIFTTTDGNKVNEREESAMASSSVPRTRPRPELSHPLVHLSFSHDASCVVAADATTVHWLSCDAAAAAASLRGLYQERRANRAVVAACGDMLDVKASTCAVVTTTRPAAAAAAEHPSAAFAVRRWRPGYLNYHWRYDEWTTDIGAGGDGEVRAVAVHGDKTFLIHDGRVDVYGPGAGDGGGVHEPQLLRRVEMELGTTTRPGGGMPLCAASASQDAPLAFACAGAEAGEVRVERWAAAAEGGFAPPSSFRAHSSRLACLAVSRDGGFVATASIKGTIVRVFHAAEGTLLRELRRGADRADIHSMAFSPDSKWLAVSSDKGTIHVFSVNVDVPLPAQEDSSNPDSPNAGSALNAKQKQGSSWSFISGFVPGYFRQDVSLAKFRLREGVKYVVAFSHEPNTVLVVGMDGSFYRCQFDPVKGGDMKQLEYRNFMKMT